ncbi:possible permease (plasmid) [Rhodococcus jostii RHA1]|uniref:Possible permease n=2 Tax=Rhodococcus jostii TaxID=132919 RepID=Q0RVU9_RHOJR|nr:possible permease [Rhodococcus jostii RHA1]
MQSNITGGEDSPGGAALPEDHRVPRWSLTMAFWGMTSAMIWLYIGQAASSAVGPMNTLIAMVLTVATYGIINAMLARRAIETGETVSLFSNRVFGSSGSAVAALLFGVTALYFATFEGSLMSIALQQYFGGDIKIWYLVIIVVSVPLVAGGVQNWLDRLNGILLPFYVLGLAAILIASTVKRGYPDGWLSAPAPPDLPLPGWLQAYLIFMGAWVMMMYTFDFARHGRRNDADFHAKVTFGWVFYAVCFIVAGLCGIYLTSSWDHGNSEAAIISAILSSLGGVGLFVFLISQIRIQSANFFSASGNLERFVEQITGKATPRLLWVVLVGVGCYLFMLTNVVSYLTKALAWQGVFITSWVIIALAWLIVTGRRPRGYEDNAPAGKLSWPVLAWIIASAFGIALVEQKTSLKVSLLAPLITVAATLFLYVPWILQRRKVAPVRAPEATGPDLFAQPEKVVE